MAENLDERFEQIGLACAVFADKDIDTAAAIKAQGKIPKVLVLADIERCQAHGIASHEDTKARRREKEIDIFIRRPSRR
jgi:hypothetical protein